MGPLALHSTRWVHVRVALGDSSTLPHTVSVYGVVGAVSPQWVKARMRMQSGCYTSSMVCISL